MDLKMILANWFWTNPPAFLDGALTLNGRKTSAWEHTAGWPSPRLSPPTPGPAFAAHHAATVPSLQRPVAFSFPFGTYQGGTKTPKSLSWLLIPVGLRRNPLRLWLDNTEKGGLHFTQDLPKNYGLDHKSFAWVRHACMTSGVGMGDLMTPSEEVGDPATGSGGERPQYIKWGAWPSQQLGRGSLKFNFQNATEEY